MGKWFRLGIRRVIPKSNCGDQRHCSPLSSKFVSFLNRTTLTHVGRLSSCISTVTAVIRARHPTVATLDWVEKPTNSALKAKPKSLKTLIVRPVLPRKLMPHKFQDARVRNKTALPCIYIIKQL